jgi:hypothetical protein
MRDRRDYAIAALAGALLFCVGLLVGQHAQVLPEAAAQGTANSPAHDPQASTANPPGPGITIVPPAPSPKPPGTGRTSAGAPSDSDSNNRFVAVTCPTNSGESVLFLIDSQTEQLAVYRYRWGQGLEYLSGRKIEYDLKVSGYRDMSQYTYDEMREFYQKEAARQAAKAAGK